MLDKSLDRHLPGTEVAKGKTKIIETGDELGTVIITSTNHITAGDGARRIELKNKGVYSTETTKNVFRLLHQHGIATHFIPSGKGFLKNHQFLAQQARMIPVEVVVRRIAFGSYLKRNPYFSAGEKLSRFVVEFFWKDDANHDPLMIIDPVGERVLLYKPSEPFDIGFAGERYLGANEDALEWTLLKRLLREGVEVAKSAFAVLTKSFAAADVTLVDAKFEFGINQFGQLVLADVVDNDSWRIWPQGDPTKAFDKQVFRDAANVTPELLEKLGENYAWVQTMTAGFL